MRGGVNVLFAGSVAAALLVLVPMRSIAERDGRNLQDGEELWVPSLAITSGVWLQAVDASGQSQYFEGTMPPVPLRSPVSGSDLGVSAFVGATLELMTPAIPVPTRPRIFLSAEVVPTFSPTITPAQDGAPGCVRGPEPEDPCASMENGTRRRAYGEDAANGQGSQVSTDIDTLAFGAGMGVAFPFAVGKRQLRVKTSVAWVNYKVNASGLVVDAQCDPTSACTESTPIPGFPPNPGFLREVTLMAESSERFNGIGPGLDLEMDTGRFGPIGSSIFLGARFYRILGDRKITLGTAQSYDDQIGMDSAAAQFQVEVKPWLYRASLGVRFQWLGARKE